MCEGGRWQSCSPVKCLTLSCSIFVLCFAAQFSDEYQKIAAFSFLGVLSLFGFICLTYILRNCPTSEGT